MTAVQPRSTAVTTFGPVVIRYDARVLRPRTWTLMQSHWASELAREISAGPILELCAGAGQIGLAAAVLTDRALVQVEAAPIAADYARTNAAMAGRADQVEVRNAPMEAALTVGERFPIILADPPYLPTANGAYWPDDPPSAIDGGSDGLDVIRVCLRLAAQHLTHPGALLLQVAGAAQAQAVTGILETTPELGLTHRATRSHDRHRAVMLMTTAPA